MKYFFYGVVIPFFFLVIHFDSFSSDKFDFSSLEKVPILHEGRVKPLLTFSEVILKKSYGQKKMKGYHSIEFLINLLFNPDQSFQLKFYKIKESRLLEALGLEKNSDSLYSIQELANAIQKILPVFSKIFSIQKDERDFLQSQLLDLYQNVGEIYLLMRSLTLIIPQFKISSHHHAKRLKIQAGVPISYLDLLTHYEDFKLMIDEIHKKGVAKISHDENEILLIGQSLDLLENDKRSDILKIIPVSFADSPLVSPWQILANGQGSPLSSQFLHLWKEIQSAHTQDNIVKFNQTSIQLLNLYQQQVKNSFYDPMKIELEWWYYKIHFFQYALFVFFGALILALIARGRFFEFLIQSSFSLIIIGELFQALGLILRCLIMERPPVSTLYESILFVSFIMSLVGIILYLKNKSTMGIQLASFSPLFLLLLAKGYEADGDTLTNLMAVLNTNFWLAIHVVTITIGYGLVLIVGLIAHQILLSSLRKVVSLEISKIKLRKEILFLRKMILISFLFSVAGTILGGFWADQSWGRFWGWDPKENGALLIVFWLILILHGKMSEVLNDFRFLLLTCFSTVVVALAWFGVNLLSVGLHSYGFTNHAALNLFIFIFIQILIIVILAAAHYQKKSFLVK